jgi:hypothetical protein
VRRGSLRCHCKELLHELALSEASIGGVVCGEKIIEGLIPRWIRGLGCGIAHLGCYRPNDSLGSSTNDILPANPVQLLG